MKRKWQQQEREKFQEDNRILYRERYNSRHRQHFIFPPCSSDDSYSNNSSCSDSEGATEEEMRIEASKITLRCRCSKTLALLPVEAEDYMLIYTRDQWVCLVDDEDDFFTGEKSYRCLLCFQNDPTQTSLAEYEEQKLVCYRCGVFEKKDKWHHQHFNVCPNCETVEKNHSSLTRTDNYCIFCKNYNSESSSTDDDQDERLGG